MADKTEERQAIVIALTTEQTEHIWRGIGVVVTELTIHLGDEQAPQAPRMFPPGPSAQAYPPGPSRAYADPAKFQVDPMRLARDARLIQGWERIETTE